VAITDKGKNGKKQSARGQPDGPHGRPGRQTYADLISDPLVRKWARRGAIALVVGLLFTLVIGFRVGLAAAVLAVIVDSVRRARLNSSVQAWQKSSAAERRTERQLRALEKGDWRILHARAVPMDEHGVSDGKIDHVVVGPTGIYAIDSENWDRRLPVRALSHTRLYHGPFDKKERLDEARWEADQASKLISDQLGYQIQVQPSVAIYGPAISWKVLRVRDVDVYSGGRARTYLRRRPKVLSNTDIQRISQAAERVLPPKYPQDPADPEDQ
jgi:hypothetical protein